MSVTAIVLAAGLQPREGTPRALVELRGSTRLVQIANCARAAGVSAITVVIGPPDGTTIKAKIPPGVGFTWNPDPSRGMLSSVQAAIANLPRGTQYVLLWPVEIATVQAATVRVILDAEPGQMVAPRHQGEPGYPLRLPRQLFSPLMALPSDGDLEAFLRGHADSQLLLDVDDAGVLGDRPLRPSAPAVPADTRPADAVATAEDGASGVGASADDAKLPRGERRPRKNQ